MREEQKRGRWLGWSRRLTCGLALGLIVAGPPSAVLAGERIVLLELRSDGSVMEINPATRVTFRDLDKYLDRRLSGKQVLEIKLQEHREGCKQIVLIRYEE